MACLATFCSHRPLAHQVLFLLLLSIIVWHGMASQKMQPEIVDECPLTRRRGRRVAIAADACSNRQRSLSRRVAMTLQNAGWKDLSPKKIVNYERTFLIAYNKLRKGVCSSERPLAVADVKFLANATSPTAGVFHRVLKCVFQVTFTCKWCDSNTTLFYNAVTRRRLKAEEEWDRVIAAEQHVHSHTVNALNDVDLESRNSTVEEAGKEEAEEEEEAEKDEEAENDEKAEEKNGRNLKKVGSVAEELLPAWKWTELYQARCSNELNQFETSFIIPFTADSTKPVTSTGLAVLAQGVLETINSFYVLREGSCDSLFRVAISAKTELLISGARNRRELATTSLSVKVNLRYQCNGCTSGTTLLEHDVGQRRRQLESENCDIDEHRNLVVAVGAGECYCPVGANHFEVPTRSEFSAAFNETVAFLITRGTIDFVTSVGNVSEVVEFECPPPQQERQTGLILRACSGSLGLSSSQQQAVADAIEASLNELIVRNCDQEFLAITDVRVIDAVVSGVGCAGTRYLYVVDFNCLDCKLDSKILSNTTAEAWSTEAGGNGMSRRSLEETCVCDVSAVTSGRRMTEVSYSPSQLLSLVTAKLTTTGLKLFDLSESSAPLSCGQVIETSFLIECTGDPTLITPSGLASFAQGVVDTVNFLYDESGICDPFFRVSISAEAELVNSTVDVDSNLRERVLATNGKKFSVKVNVSYQCKNCKKGTTLLKNAARRRRLESESPLERRSLFTFSAGADPCTCPDSPPGAPEFESPSRSEFIDAFNKTVDVLKATKPEVNAFVDGVGSTTEVVEYSCSAPVENRTTYMTLRACNSGRKLLNMGVYQLVIEDSIQASLTELLAKFCNRQSRIITSVSFLNSRTGTSDCSTWAYFFSVVFTCRGCPLDMELLSNTTSRRALVGWSQEIEDGSNRHLSGVSGTCFCDVGTIDSRGPSESEMAVILGDKLKSRINGTLIEVSDEGTANAPVPAPTKRPTAVPTGLPSQSSQKPSRIPSGAPSQSSQKPSRIPSGAPSQACDQVVETSLLIECTGDPALVTPRGLDTFAQGVVSTVNALYDESGICDPFFRAAISAEAELVNSTIDVDSNLRERVLATNGKKFSVKVNVNYKCKNCKKGTTLLKNDATRLRRLESENPLERRSLFTISAGDDPCTCPDSPPGAPEFESPSRSEFNDAFNKTVEVLKASNPEVNAFVESVGSTTEVVEYSCSAPVENRKTYMTLRACISGVRPLNMDFSRLVIEDSIQASLTELLAKFCNRQSRIITSVSFLSSRPGTSECSTWAYFFSVDFTCRGCPLDMELLSNSTSRRALVGWGQEVDDGSNRFLSGASDTCFCDIGTIDSREPRESEMAVILGDSLSLLIGATVLEISDQGTANAR